ncbi:cytochrome P450 [Xylariales sp. PMI_506]|nr:cytochrome P450 [Xylariales sp. PMI_506]
MDSIVIKLVGGIVVVQFCWHLILWLRSPVRFVPGPWLARYTDAWYFWNLHKGHFENVNEELHKKYGSIVRYGPNRFSFSDEEASKAIYGHGTLFPKSSWYSSWVIPGTWTMFADQDIPRHAQNRRLYQNMYSMTSLLSYEPYVDECVDLFSQRLGEIAQGGASPVNMGHWMQCYAFDVIGYMTYSKRLGFLDHGKDIGNIISALELFLYEASVTGVYAWLHPYIHKLKSSLPGLQSAGRPYVISFTQERMAEHQAKPQAFKVDKNNMNNAVDFLTKFFAAHARDATSFSSYHIIAGCGMNMLAGSDTTAISLSAMLYYLLKHPDCLHKLRQEIEDFRIAGKIGDRHIKFKDTQEMPYLQAVIKEALRLHPAAGLPLERVVPTGGATIAGCFFPAGTIVGVNAWVEHRNIKIFGSDADTFRPERWLTDDSERLAVMNRHWMPFGLGTRTCLGRHISYLEISKLIPRLVKDFDFELAEHLKPATSHWETANYWFVKPRNFMVQVKSRSR